MSSTKVIMGLAIILSSMLWVRKTIAQSSDCTSTIISLAPCLNFVTGTSSTPTSQCCSQLSTVVQTNPRCLCMILDGSASSLGVTVNRTLALALPAACNVKTPPVSKCNEVIGSPSSSEADTARSTTGSGTSDGTGVLKKPLQLVLFVVIATSYATAWIGI